MSLKIQKLTPAEENALSMYLAYWPQHWSYETVLHSLEYDPPWAVSDTVDFAAEVHEEYRDMEIKDLIRAINDAKDLVKRNG